MPVSDAASLITRFIGQAEVRIANRNFTEFAVIGQPGVATAWKQAPTSSDDQAVHQAESPKSAA